MDRRKFIKTAAVAAATTTIAMATPSVLNGIDKKKKMSKVLLINGSAREEGNTFIALSEVAKELEKQGVQTEILQIGSRPVHHCIACGGCEGRKRCVFDDDLCNEIIAKAEQSDGFVFGTPVYYGVPNGAILSIIQRCFYAGGEFFRHKPYANVAACRRGGATSAFSTMNIPFQMMSMPQATSRYWNIIYGLKPGDALKDKEGLCTMRTLACNMAWMLDNLSGAERPKHEDAEIMNFIR